MTRVRPEPIRRDHRLDSFDCGKPTTNNWLIRHALQAQSSGSARTFVSTEDAQVVGYYSLTVGEAATSDASERIRRGMGRYPIPVIILARLAVSLSHQGNGIGTGLLRDAVSRTLWVAEQAGIRALFAHPTDEDAARFYVRFGFVASPLRENQLLLLLKDAHRLISDRKDPCVDMQT